MNRAAFSFSRGLDVDALLPAVFIRLDESGGAELPASVDLQELRVVSPLFAVRTHATSFDEHAIGSVFDGVIQDDVLRRGAEVSRLAALAWRRRLATQLEQRHSCRVLTEALAMCGRRPEPPSSVIDLAGAAGVSREHFARTLRSNGTRESFCAKRLVDVFMVLQILVMHSMGMSHRRAAIESRVPYRTFLRARYRLEQEIPGSTANFRALMVHVDVHLAT